MNVNRVNALEYLNAKNGSITIDLRTPAECESESIDGCIYLPVQNLSQPLLEEALKEAEHSGEPVYLLCQSGRRADIAIEKLEGLNNIDLVVIKGGLNALKNAGAEIRTGERKVISIERQVRIAAGALTALGVMLGLAVHPSFFGLSAFVGLGLMFAGITDTCGMAMVLARMPWNGAQKI